MSKWADTIEWEHVEDIAAHLESALKNPVAYEYETGKSACFECTWKIGTKVYDTVVSIDADSISFATWKDGEVVPDFGSSMHGMDGVGICEVFSAIFGVMLNHYTRF